MTELNNLFDEVTSWSRLSSACRTVVLDQEEKTPEEEKFQEQKLMVRSWHYFYSFLRSFNVSI